MTRWSQVLAPFGFVSTAYAGHRYGLSTGKMTDMTLGYDNYECRNLTGHGHTGNLKLTPPKVVAEFEICR